MCRRSDNDPLVRVLTDRYKLNILRLPRSNVEVGELLINEGKDLKCIGSIGRFFDPELDFQVDGPVPLPALGGLTSVRVSASIAAAPLAGLLTALGAIGVSSIGARLKRAREVSVVFGLNGAEYRSTDLVALGDELAGRVLRRDNALYSPGREFFVAYAAAAAKEIKVAFSANSEKAAELALEVEQLIKAETSVDVAKNEEGYLVVSGPEPVTFGIAVVQLTLNGSNLRFEAVDRLRAVRRAGSKSAAETGEIPNVFFGGADGEVFVEIGA